MRALTVLWCSLVLSGCGVWRRSPSALDAPLRQRQPVQIWLRDRALTAHGVAVRGDSVRAIPRWKPPTCDSCAVYYARAEIDSVRIRVAAPIRTAILAIPLIAATVVSIVLATNGRWMN